MIRNYVAIPTTKRNPNFNVAEWGTTLREAMKGLGTDEDKIIEVLTSCSGSQRQELVQFFAQELGRNLEDDLRSELGGKFESLIVGLITPPAQYLARQLNKAMDGLGTNSNVLIEVISTRTNEEMKDVVEAYESMYNRPLAEHLCSETSGDFRKFLTLIVTGVRNPPGNIDESSAQALAEELYNAGEGTAGTKEEVFNRILSHESYDQLALIFEKYKSVSGHTIEQALNSEVSGDLKEAMLAVVECVQSPPEYFAKQLKKAVEGAGTDDSSLIRIIVSRCDIDLENIKQEYERIYDITLESSIKSETSGDYKKALLALIGTP
ncbi:annexin B10-like isoform X2 [Planococcus citri]|uniref:annexin B10-like isoform X2 n=1 Tax=Planococcus citri TaxID=170843 RepID=UPI0031F78F0B